MPWGSVVKPLYKSSSSIAGTPVYLPFPNELGPKNSFYTIPIRQRERGISALAMHPDRVAAVARIYLDEEELKTLPPWVPRPSWIVWLSDCFEEDEPIMPKGVAGTARCSFNSGHSGGIHHKWLSLMRPSPAEPRKAKLEPVDGDVPGTDNEEPEEPGSEPDAEAAADGTCAAPAALRGVTDVRCCSSDREAQVWVREG